MRKETLGLAMILVFAWVLWGNESSHITTGWKVISGHDSLKECKRAVPPKVGKLLKLNGAARREADVVYFSKPNDRFYGETTLRLVCLPDTVDPRGPR